MFSSLDSVAVGTFHSALCLLDLGWEVACRFLSTGATVLVDLLGVANTAVACLGLALSGFICAKVIAALILDVPNAGVRSCWTIWHALAGVSRVAEAGGCWGSEMLSVDVASDVVDVVDSVMASAEMASAVTCGGVPSSLGLVLAARLLLCSTGPVEGGEASAGPASFS